MVRGPHRSEPSGFVSSVALFGTASNQSWRIHGLNINFVVRGVYWECPYVATKVGRMERRQSACRATREEQRDENLSWSPTLVAIHLLVLWHRTMFVAIQQSKRSMDAAAATMLRPLSNPRALHVAYAAIDSIGRRPARRVLDHPAMLDFLEPQNVAGVLAPVCEKRSECQPHRLARDTAGDIREYP